MKTFSLLFFLLFLSQAQAAEKIFRVRLSEDLGTFDWNYGEINPEVVYQIMEGLFTSDDKGAPRAAIAKSYQWNKEKTELNIILKKKFWSDGRQVCAEDFVQSWNRLKSKEFASPYAHYGNGLKDFSSNGCEKLRVNFTRSSPEALAYFSHYVFFPIRADQVKNNFPKTEELIVNGPFKIKKYETNRKLILEKNPKYAGNPAFLDQVEFIFVGEDSTAKIFFEKGEIDWMKDVSPLLRGAALEKSQEFKIYPSFTTFYYGLNADKSKLLTNKEIRWALSESLNRAEIPIVLGKENLGVKNWVAKEIFPALKTRTKNINLEKVKKILLDAKQKSEMDIVLRVYDKPAHKLLAEWAQGQWEKKLGVRIPIEVQEGKVYWKGITSNPGAIHISGITAPYGHPRAYLQEFLTASTANWTSWRSTDFDQAVNEEKFQKAEDLLMDAGFVIPLYTRNAVALVQKKWKGFFINPLGQIFLSRVR